MKKDLRGHKSASKLAQSPIKPQIKASEIRDQASSRLQTKSHKIGHKPVNKQDALINPNNSRLVR